MPPHHATQYSVREEDALLHRRKGSQDAACNAFVLQELLSGKSECNSLWYLGTRLGEDPGSYLNPGSFPLLLELQQLPSARYAKEPGDTAVRSS